MPSSAAAKRGTRSARPTEARIQSYLSTVHPLPGSEVRPTESQLRWAAFHSKSKARYTRSLVEALMARPAGVEDVEKQMCERMVRAARCALRARQVELVKSESMPLNALAQASKVTAVILLCCCGL